MGLWAKMGGGLIQSGGAINDFRDTTDDLYFTMGPNNSYPTIDIFTYTHINLTNIKNIHMVLKNWSSSKGYGYNINKTLGVSVNRDTTFTKSLKYTSKQSTSTVTQNYDLDVSELTGEYYVVMSLYFGPSYRFYFQITELSLS